MASEKPDKLGPRRIEPEFFRTAYPKSRGRIAGIFLGVSAAILWIAFYHFADQTSIFSPGKLASAHAMWNTDCTSCHQPNPKGGFFLSVSDQSCLHCHSANIHSANQVEFISADGSGSANCTHCHMEHQGRDRLIDRTGQSCVACHADLPHHARSPATAVKPSIVEFTLASHPSFGNNLPMKNGTAFDPTQLVFSHKIHLAKDLQLTCISCHHLAPDGSGPGGQPPTPQNAGNAAMRAYMQPVSFERDCLTCHQMKFGEEKIPHANMAIVRDSIGRLAGAQTSPFMLASQAGQDQGDDSQGDTSNTASPRLTKNDAALGVMGPGVTKIASASLTTAYGNLKNAVLSKPIGPPGTFDPRLIQFYIFFENINNCAKCHTANTGDPTFWPQSDKSSPSLLSTGDTGIGTTPRQWYVHSIFDHNAHRFMFENDGSGGCLVCHAPALGSDGVSQILLPNIESCVSCHHPPDSAGAGSGAACLECHVYHERGVSAVAKVAAATH
jgi:hypothetical protein